MLLFNKICSIAQVLSLLLIALETGNIPKSYKRSVYVLRPGVLLYEIQMTVVGYSPKNILPKNNKVEQTNFRRLFTTKD